MRGKNIILRAGLNLGPASANKIRLVPDNAHYVKISGSPHNDLLLSLRDLSGTHPRLSLPYEASACVTNIYRLSDYFTTAGQC